MAEAGRGEAEQKRSPRVQNHARDLLRRFSGSFRPEEVLGAVAASSAVTGEEDSAEIELSLGLSLGGCFGVDPAQRRGGLVRSSSIAALPFLQRAEQDPPVVPVLARTCSLPVEAEEEQRKRKELQCLRRMEAKRKRSEKRNSARAGARERSAPPPAEEGGGGGEDTQQDGNGDAVGEGKTEAERLRAAPYGAVAAILAARAAARAAEGTRGFTPASQGSVGSQGSCSSGVSDFDPRPLSRQGSGVGGIGTSAEPRRQSSMQALANIMDNKAVIGPASPTMGRCTSSTGTEADDLPEKVAPAGGGNGMRNMMEEMPCVSTRGGGPGGRRVEGFLYRYQKGEEVRIVCVCHGKFFSPAEFVKHAGGGDVAHPLRHIVVNPNPSCFL